MSIVQRPAGAVPTGSLALSPSRLPYHPAVEKQFGIDPTTWRALVESTFPGAKTTEAVLLALSYCKARHLDPFKRTVHIVPIWDKERKCEVETVWPGIAEYRTTAFRTKLYAGHDPIDFGPTVTERWPDGDGEVELRFPEWAQLTVYRLVEGQRCAFPGPRVYWLETYASKKNGAPNKMWSESPMGMIGKCAEAAALRGAFPEELGDEWSAEEAGARLLHGRPAVDVPSSPAGQPRSEVVIPAISAPPSPPPAPQGTVATSQEELPPVQTPSADPPHPVAPPEARRARPRAPRPAAAALQPQATPADDGDVPERSKEWILVYRMVREMRIKSDGTRVWANAQQMLKSQAELDEMFQLIEKKMQDLPETLPSDPAPPAPKANGGKLFN